MNKWRLLLFSVFGLLQITTSDRNFINGRYSCYDHSQRFSESGTRITAYEPYQVYRGVPDLQQRKLLDSPLPVREHDIKSPTRNVRQRELPFEGQSNRRHAYERHLSRDRNGDNNHSERDETRQKRLGRNRDKLTLHSRFVDVSRYSYKFNNGDRVNRENNNMRQYVSNNHLPLQRSFDEGRRNDQRFEPKSENSKESVINTRRNPDSVSNNRLQPTPRNTYTNRPEDQRLFRRNTQVRNRSVEEGSLRLIRESTQIKENQVDRRHISKRNSNSVRHSTSEELRRVIVENRKRSFPLDSEQLLDVRKQVLTQLGTMNTIVGHILYSRDINQIYDTDNSRTISKGIQYVRTTETEQSNRRERDINNIRTKQRKREILDVRGKRNGLQNYMAQDNFNYRQNTVDSYRTRDIQKIRESINVPSETKILRESRNNNNDKDRSRNLLLLFRYRYSESDNSRKNRNRIVEDNSHHRLNIKREELIRPQTSIRLENNAIRVNINREDRFNIKRHDTSMTNHHNGRNNRKISETRQEREMLRRGIKVNKYNIRRHARYSSKLYVHSDKLDQDLTDVIHEENTIREDNYRQARRNIRQQVRDVSSINIRNEQRRESDDARRERRIRENNRQYTLNARQSPTTLRTVNTLDIHRVMNTLNEELLIAELENVQNKRDFREQVKDKFRWQTNDRKLKSTLRNMHEVSFRQRMREISVHTDSTLNELRNNRDNFVKSDQNTQRMHKRLNNRQVDKSETHRANTLHNDDRAYDLIIQNRNHDFIMSNRYMRNLYDEQYINRNGERIHRREFQRVNYLHFRRDARDVRQSRSDRTIKTYRTRDDNEGLLSAVHVRLSMRTYRGEPKLAVRSEDSRRIQSQSVTENRESNTLLRLTKRDGIFNTRNTRRERDSDDGDARRDTRRLSAIAEYRIVPLIYTQDTEIFEMKWQYLFYALQAIYMLSLFTKVTKHVEGKNKSRIITWITPAKSLKMD